MNLPNHNYALQFGSHGVDIRTPLLKSMQQDTDMVSFFKQVVQALGDIERYIAPENSDTNEQLCLEKWLHDDKSIQLPRSISDLTLTVVYHAWLAYKLEIMHSGLEDLITKSKAIFGHSVGLISASFLTHYSSSMNLENLIDSMIKYVFMLTFRSQQHYQKILGTNVIRHAPMLSLTKITAIDLKQAIDQFKGLFPESPSIDLGLKNADQFCVVVGYGPSLDHFRKWISVEPKYSSIEFIDPGFTVPYHSDLLSGIHDKFQKDGEFIGFDFSLHIPRANLISSFSGENISFCNDLSKEVVNLVCKKPILWEETITPVLKSLPKGHIYDFGPGPLVKLFTQNAIRKHNLSVKQVSVTQQWISLCTNRFENEIEII